MVSKDLGPVCLAEPIHLNLALFILLIIFILKLIHSSGPIHFSTKNSNGNIECLAEHIHPLNLFILLAIFIRGPKSQMSRWAYSSSKTIHPAGPIHPSTKEWCQTRLGWGWYYSILNCQAGWGFLRFLGRKRIVTYNSQILFQGVWDKFVLTKTSPNAHCTLQSPPLHLCTLHRLESELSLTPSRFSCSVVHHICPRYLSLKLTNENTHKWISIHIEHSTSSVVVFMANFGKTLSGVHFPIEILKNPQRFSVVSFAIFCHFKFSKNRWWWW